MRHFIKEYFSHSSGELCFVLIFFFFDDPVRQIIVVHTCTFLHTVDKDQPVSAVCQCGI